MAIFAHTMAPCDLPKAFSDPLDRKSASGLLKDRIFLTRTGVHFA
jgi:hypothetical protein